MTIEDICNQSDFVVPEAIDPSKTPIIKVVGVGGGGGNAVGYMFRKNVENVKFVVCNTDKQALDNSPVPDKVLLGHTGLGAGNDPEVAYQAAQESIDAINHIFDDTTKMVFITAGLGGGTGTGAAPVVAKVAREKGVLTVGIVTIPFFFEGMKKITKALQGAEEMRKYVDALLLINNERLIDIYADLDFDSAFDKADDTLATAACSISELITTKETRINLDFNDVDTTLRDGGTAIISCGYGEGPDRVNNAIDDALQSPLLKNRDIKGSKKLLFNLYYAKQNSNTPFLAREMTAFTNFITSLVDVDVIYGVAYDETLGDRVKVTILAAGFEMENLAPKSAAESGGKSAAGKSLGVGKPQANTPAGDSAQIDVIAGQYGQDKVADARIQKARNLYVVLNPSQFDSDAVIERLEKYPAFNRTKEEKRSITELTVNAPASSVAQAVSHAAGHNSSDNSSQVIDFTLE
jgi:cell division protein FtsZ